jgi:tetratricopeptide (TPR) repeat protein
MAPAEPIVRALGMCSVGQLARSLRTLTRVAADRGEIADAARGVLDQRLPELLRRVTESPDTDADVHEALRLAVQSLRPGAGAVAVTELPSITRTSAPLIAEVLFTAATALEPNGPDSHSEGALHDVAWTHDHLAVAFAMIGHQDWSLLASQRAVHARRALVERHGDAEVPNLGAGLANLGFRLAELDRHEEAVMADRESVGLFRQLVAAGDSDHRAGLATALVNVSVSLSELGEAREALTASAEAVELRRAIDGDTSEGLSDLATALHNLAGDLADVGRTDEALAAIEEAVAIRRILAEKEKDPDKATAGLARSLNNLSVRLGAVDRRTEALAAVREAVWLCRALAATDPDRYLPELATSLSNLSVDLSATGAPADEALAATAESVRICRSLAKDRFEQFAAHLARALQNSAVDLAAVGQPDQAIAATREAVEIRRKLTDNQFERHAPGLARTLRALAARLTPAGYPNDSVDAAEEAVAIVRKLTESRPDAFRPELASTLNSLSIRLRAADRHSEALVVMQELVEVRRDLVEANSQGSQQDLAAALSSLASDLARAGRQPESLAAADEAVQIRRALEAGSETQASTSLAAALESLAARLRELNRPGDALAAVQEVVRIRRALTDVDPREGLPRLVTAVNELAGNLAALNRPGEVPPLFDQLYDEHRHDPWTAGVVLLGRAWWHGEHGDVAAAITDARQAIELLDTDPARQADGRLLLQTMRRADPDRFDHAWGDPGPKKPEWLRHLRHDAPRIELIQVWYDSSLEDAEAFLACHAETLLTDEGEATLRRLSDRDPNNRGLRLLSEILRAARERGVPSAYAEYSDQLWKTAIRESLDSWFATPTEEGLRQLLSEHEVRLLSAEAQDQRDALIASDSATPDTLWRAGLLTLCRTDGVLAAFQILGDADGLRRPPGRRGLTAFEPRMLALARIRAGRNPDDPEAHFVHAALALVAGNHAEADTAIARCAETSSSWDRRERATHLSAAIPIRPDLTDGWTRLRSIMGRIAARAN